LRDLFGDRGLQLRDVVEKSDRPFLPPLTRLRTIAHCPSSAASEHFRSRQKAAKIAAATSVLHAFSGFATRSMPSCWP
jgi:hypothetical protein